MTTKSEQIREMLAAGKSTREIADAVGCHIAYVRVAGRQRKGGGPSRADKRYLTSKYGTQTIQEARKLDFRVRYTDPVFRKRHNEFKRTARARQRLAQAENHATG